MALSRPKSTIVAAARLALLFVCAIAADGPPRAAGQEFVERQTPAYTRRQVFVGLPTTQENAGGQLFVAPNINVAIDPYAPIVPGRAVFQPTNFAEDLASAVLQSAPEPVVDPIEPLPTLPEPEPDMGAGGEPPIFADLVRAGSTRRRAGGRLRMWWQSGRNGEPGLGNERLAHLPFELDSSAPCPSVLLRFNSYNGTPYPDRAEYLWAKSVTGRGPRLPESRLDYQEARFRMELGNKRFSTATEFPLRWTNPAVNPNHAGFGDMRLTIKTVLLDGDTVQLTQIFRSIFPTGAPSMGLGTGHVAFEPGFLARYKYNDDTFFYGEFKYLFPVGGDRTFSGQVLTYGTGMGRVLWQRDSTAVMPVLELSGGTILNGLRTNSIGLAEGVDGDHIISFCPGLRVARDRGGDLGLFEWGISGGFPLTGPRLYDGFLRFELRKSF